MHGKRTPAWYLTRLLLVGGIGLSLIAALLVVSWFDPTVDHRPTSYLAAALLIAVAAFLGMLVGFTWMIRIIRGPRHEPPPWRYRDR